MRYEIDIFHYLELYKKELKKLILLVVIAVGVAAFTEYMQPVTYKSTVIALSSKQGAGQAVSFGGILGLGNIYIANSSDEVVFSILKSRRMNDDVNRQFNPNNKPRFWWELDTYIVTGGFAVEVKGSDPAMTKDIANFAVENVDKINLELQISPSKPMIKVLDLAINGVPVKRNISKRCIAAGLFVFLMYTLFIFFKEYFSNMKMSKNAA